MRDYLFAFEGATEELTSPPLAALRALHGAGVLLSRAGWEALPVATRQALARAGAEERVDAPSVRRLLDAAPVTEVKLLPAEEDPDPRAPPSQLGGALGPGRSPSPELWERLRPLDRYAMSRLAQNPRLLHRLLDELARRPGLPPIRRPTSFTGVVAHAEVQLTDEVIRRLRFPTQPEGAAFHLARAAGVRAARRTHELLEVGGDDPIGPVELAATERRGANAVIVVWQGHASTLGGRFSRAASLLAVSTAAAALYDLVVDWFEPGAIAVQNTRLMEERWLADDQDETTLV
ncbi:MAG TPA: nitrate reductase associated protein [Polyangiaceae bacterium]|nr:nitrate reductase associated protein [Polyangiaceae bacterium]